MTNETKTVTLAEIVESHLMTRRLDVALVAHGTTVSQVALLSSIAAAPVVRLVDLARTIGMTPTVLTIAIDRLEQHGLAQRVKKRSLEGPADRRRVAVELTDRGRELLASLATIEVEL